MFILLCLEILLINCCCFFFFEKSKYKYFHCKKWRVFPFSNDLFPIITLDVYPDLNLSKRFLFFYIFFSFKQKITCKCSLYLNQYRWLTNYYH